MNRTIQPETRAIGVSIAAAILVVTSSCSQVYTVHKADLVRAAEAKKQGQDLLVPALRGQERVQLRALRIHYPEGYTKLPDGPIEVRASTPGGKLLPWGYLMLGTGVAISVVSIRGYESTCSLCDSERLVTALTASTGVSLALTGLIFAIVGHTRPPTELPPDPAPTTTPSAP